MTKNFAANLKIGAVMGSTVGRVFGSVNSKIKAQEAELKRLRAAYKQASSGSGEFAGSLQKLEREIADAEAKMKRLRAAAKINLGASMGKIGNSLASDAKRLGVVGGVVAASGVGIAKSMLDVTAEFEKSLTVLKTIEGDAGKAKQSFAWIQDFAQKTPFELQQVTDAFVRLKAYGIDPIRGDALRVLGDTASAMGKDVMDAVEAIADAVTGENERLKEFGIKASKEAGKITYTWTDRAGKQMRKSVDENNRAMIQSTILAIWNSKYKGAMDEQSKTWNGMVSNLKDAWARFAYDVMQSGPFEQLKNQLQGFLDKLAVWAKDGTMKKWANETGAALTKFGTQVGDLATQIWKGLDASQKFLGGWDKLGYALLALNFAPTIAAVGSMTASLITLTGVTWAAAAPWLALAALVGSVFYILTNQDKVGEWWEQLVGTDAMLAVGNSLLEIERFFNGLPQAFEDAANQIDQTWQRITQRIDEFTTRMVDGVNSTVTKIGDAFLNLTVWVEKQWFKAGDAIRQFFVSMADGAKIAVQAVKDVFSELFGWLEAQWNKVGSAIDGMWNRAKSLGDSVKSFFSFSPASSAAPAVAPPDQMPARDTKTSQNNQFNINVSAPGGDGRRIADQIRNEFNRKPLFDMDGALAPG